MIARHIAGNFLRLVITSAMLASASAVFAADTSNAAPSAPSKEMREKMAGLHEKMAACLRSDKAFGECRTEMMKNCQDTLGKEGCPMMSASMGMQGMHSGSTKKSPQAPAEKK
jgi:hypothetical protein